MNFQARLGVFPKHHHEYFANFPILFSVLSYHVDNTFHTYIISVVHIAFLHHLKQV
jgi:hypothetical protein